MIRLSIGDRVELLPSDKLIDIFERRKFFSNNFRKEAAEKLGGISGAVNKIENKYQYDYFFFMPDGETQSWSIPYESVNFNKA